MAQCNLSQMSKEVTWRLDAEAALGLANTIHGPGGHRGRRARAGEPGHDHLATPAEAVAFLASHDVPVAAGEPSPAQLARLRTIRTVIRTIVDRPPRDGRDDPDPWRVALEKALAAVRFRYAPDGVMRSAAAGWNGLADDLLPAALVLDAERDRIRRCGNPLCRWQFVDRSRNGSRVWCEMAVCGNRVKVGRSRRRPPPGSTRPPATRLRSTQPPR